MAEYYVVRDKNTGLYFRGKGVNRWGKYYNQASIYRIKANAENTIKEVSWRGEQAEIVPIQIVETTEDVVPKSEVEALIKENERWMTEYANYREGVRETIKEIKSELAREIFEKIEESIATHAYTSKSEDYMDGAFDTIEWVDSKIDELKKKYTDTSPADPKEAFIKQLVDNWKWGEEQ